MATILCKPAATLSTPVVVEQSVEQSGGQSVGPQGGEAVPPAQESERSDTSDEETQEASGSNKTSVRVSLSLVAIIYFACAFVLGSRTFPFRKRKVKFGTPPLAGECAQTSTPSVRNLIQGWWSSCEDVPLAFSGNPLSVSPEVAEFGRQLMTEMGERAMRSIENGKLLCLSRSSVMVSCLVGIEDQLLYGCCRVQCTCR